VRILNAGFLISDSSFLEKSPLKYFMGEVYSGNSLRSTISVGNEKKRQRVYNTMFHAPWRCERVSSICKLLTSFFLSFIYNDQLFWLDYI
jgi:hypothetical protein